jgi:hypothetical protein
MTLQQDFGPVIKPSTSHRTIVQAKAGDANDVQRGASRSAEASNVSSVRRNLRFDKCDVDHLSGIIPPHMKKKERRVSFESLVVPLSKTSLVSDVCVRLLKVCSVTCWFELSLLCGFLGSALLRGLFGATLFRCCLLSTFLSCHSLYVLLLLEIRFKGFFFHDHKIVYLHSSCGLE